MNLLFRAVTFFRHFRLQIFRLDAVNKAAATFVESNRYDFGLISRYNGGKISFLFLQAMNVEQKKTKKAKNRDMDQAPGRKDATFANIG